MLSIYRRHRPKCKFSEDRISKKCRCALWATGTLEGKPYRRSLKTKSFERAEQIKKQIEDGVQPQQQSKSITAALQAFVADCEARNLNRSTLGKYKRLTTSLSQFSEQLGYVRVAELTTDAIRIFRNGWKLAPRTAAKQLERLRQLFKFAVQNGWIGSNLASSLKAPQVKINPRLPFSEKEIQAILSRAKDDRELAFILVLRRSGLRIGDASLLKTSHLAENRLYLYTTKAGTPVSILLPETLVSLLKKLPPNGGYFFLRGESTSMHTTADLWRRRIKILCKEAKVMPDHPHRFRHSLAADLLNKGASVEQVAAILGNSPAIVAKHYSQWIKSRQDALDAMLEKTWATPQLALVKK